MPPSHPRPEDVAALVAALTATGEHCAAGGEDLLGHLVTVGDHSCQATLEATVDAAVDAMRELSATCRELSLALSPETGSPRHESRAASLSPEPR